MVEFAIVAFWLFLLIFGIIEFGWIFYGYITLTGAAREGARMAVVGDETSNIEDEIIALARMFDENKLGMTITPGTKYGEEAIVTVNGELDLLISFPPFPTTIYLTASATMHQEQ